MEKIFKQITDRNPEKSGWYDTDKGHLFWYESESRWSCREDKLSEEYPLLWYQESTQIFCKDLCQSLGWQGGTIHQVLAEIKRLKEIEFMYKGLCK